MAIGDRIYNWVEDRAQDWGGRLLNWSARVISWALREFMEGLEVEAKADTQEIITKIRDHPQAAGIPRNLLNRVDTSPHAWQAVLLVVAGVFIIVPMVLGLARPLANLLEYEQHRALNDARYMPMDAIGVEYRRPGETGLIESDLRDLGWTQERIDLYRELFRPLLDPDSVRQLTLRFPEQAARYKQHLEKQGWAPETIADAERLYQVIPGVQDLIRMAVREVFTPDIVAEFGQMEDFPPEFAEWATKQGLSPAWARNYWAAHWDLPGISQAFEMFHRTTLTRTDFSGGAIGQDQGRPYYKVIDEPHLDMLLRALDVMPAWRDKLTKIAYSPLTRVDVRRMHAQGTLTNEGVRRAYLDHGYSDEHAALMTDFTIKYNASTDRDLTATEILTAYRRRTIDRDTALELLGEIGYGEDEAEFKISAEDAGTAGADRQLSEAKLKALYLAGLMTRLQATAELQASGYDAQEIEYLYRLWDLESVPDTKLPTRSELSHFLAEDILSVGEFTSWMSTIGYPAQHIDWYLEEYAADQSAAARKEEELALDEADRIEKAAVKTEYLTARAGLDVRIAEVKVFIADARRSLLDIGTDAERVVLREISQRQSIDLARLSLEARQAIDVLTLELRIAARGVTPEEKAILERATLAERQAIESLTLGERESVSTLAMAEAEAVRAEVTALRAALRENIADADAEIARLKFNKAELTL